MSEEFDKFNRDNPEVYDLFKKFAVELRNAGHKHFSARAIIYRIRWHTSVKTVGSVFKINDHHSPYYARMLAANEPDFVGFFRNRAVRS